MAEPLIPVKDKVVRAESTSSIANNIGIQNPTEQLKTLSDVRTNVAAPKIPTAAKQTYTELETGDIAGGSQFIDPNQTELQIGPQAPVEATLGTAATAAKPGEVEAATYDATTIAGQTPEMVAAQGSLSDAAKVAAVTEELPEKALVSYQLNQLLGDLEGGAVPSWARPAVDQVEAALARRGLSKSSIGRDALFSAIIQSAVPIAQSNAAAELQRSNLNLNNRQMAALENARSNVQLELTNLNNEQQSAYINQQSRLQSLLSDQAAENASKQFNAANQQQVDVFMAQLETQVETFNAQQIQAMSQFNAGQTNAMDQFNSQIAFQRDQFNAQMYSQIEQSNVNWRRQINQIDTAGANAVAQANAINAFNLSNQALTLLWQDLRDSASWAFQAGENDQERSTRLAIAALSSENQKAAISADAWSAAGSFVAKLLG